MDKGIGKNVQVELLFPVAIVPVCAPRLADGLLPPKNLKDLETHVLLHSLVRPNLWPEWLAAAGLKDVEIGKPMRFETSGLTYQAALDGLGIALTEMPYVRDDITSGRLIMPFSLILQQPPLGYYLVYPRDKSGVKKFMTFRRWLLKQAQEVPKATSGLTAPNVMQLANRKQRYTTLRGTAGLQK